MILSLIFLVWAVLMIINGRPTPFSSLGRGSAHGKTALSPNNWFRYAGAVYIIGFLLRFVVNIPSIYITAWILTLIIYVIAIFKSAGKVL